jgi:hypothetical protein
MQKMLLSVVLALFMVLALVGVKHSLTTQASSTASVLMADGSMPNPPLPPDTGSGN